MLIFTLVKVQSQSKCSTVINSKKPHRGDI